MRHALIAAVAFFSLPACSAQSPAGPGWVPVLPEGTAVPGGPAERQRQEFWERMQDRTFDQVCRAAELSFSVEQGLGEHASASFRVKRRLRRLPDGRWAVVDQGRIQFPRLGIPNLVSLGPKAGVSLSFGAGLDGESIVIHPGGSERSCKELDALIDLRDLKAVLPLNAERMAKMAVGEVWKIPLRFQIGLVPSVAATEGRVYASVSFGAVREKSATVTLARLAEDRLRFRLRLDNARVWTAGMSVGAGLDGDFDLDLVEERLLGDALEPEAVREARRWLEGHLGVFGTRASGRQTMIEYVLDPRNPEKMEALARLVRGDLSLLKVFAGDRRPASSSDDWAAADLASQVAAHSDALGVDPEFAGTDRYRSSGRRLDLKVPFLARVWSSGGTSEEEYLLRDGSELSVSRAERADGSSFADIPWLGYLSKYDNAVHAEVFAPNPDLENASGSLAVYVEQSGSVRGSYGRARAMLERADGLVSRAGEQREGADGAARLPAAKWLPGPSPREGGETFYPGHSKVLTAMTVVFTPEAVVDLLTATPEALQRAFIATLDGARREGVEAILAAGKRGSAQSAIQQAAQRVLGADARPLAALQEQSVLRSLATAAEGLARDIAAAREAGNPAQQATALRKVMSGKDAGLSPERMMRILIQLIDPMNIAAEFHVVIDQDGRPVKETLRFNGDKLSDPVVRAALEARARFAAPPLTTD